MMCPRCPNAPSIVTEFAKETTAFQQQPQPQPKQRCPTNETKQGSVRTSTRVPFERHDSFVLFDYTTEPQRIESTMKADHAECTRCHFIFCPKCQRNYHSARTCPIENEYGLQGGNSSCIDRAHKSYSSVWRQSKRNLRRLATLDN